MNHPYNVLSIDPGNERSGVVVIINSQIREAADVPNNELFDKYIIPFNYQWPDGLILYEDMMPYSLQLNTQTIDTCKFIGVLENDMTKLLITHRRLYRWEVKKWVYDNFKEMCVPRIDKKIARMKANDILAEKKPKVRRNAFIYVDDKIVTAAMKLHWGIATPKIGQRTMYGLSVHSWQALGVATVYMESQNGYSGSDTGQS